MATDPSRRFLNKLGIRTIPTPETKEELERVQMALQHPRSGVETTRKLDVQDVHRNAFTGQSLIVWVMRYFHCPGRPQAIELCQQLLQKGVYRSMNHPYSVGGDFRDSAQSWYCFSEDEFDRYLGMLPDEQLTFVYRLIIGPLGIRMTSQPERPLLRSKLIGWLLKRFSDINNRAEAARFLTHLVYKGYLQQTEEEFFLFYKLEPQWNSSEISDIPLDICSICKHFTVLLSFQPEVTLSCGHKFHRACLAELQFDKMGRCSDCDANISTIKTNTELDLILPFITKILGSTTYNFNQRIEKFVEQFNTKFSASDLPGSSLKTALEDVSYFIGQLNEDVLQDLRLLTRHENGAEKCLLTLKKYIIPKIYGSLFPLYVRVNEEKDKQLYSKISSLSSTTTTESLDIKPKFRLNDTQNRSTTTTPTRVPPTLPTFKPSFNHRPTTPVTLSSSFPTRRQKRSSQELSVPPGEGPVPAAGGPDTNGGDPLSMPYIMAIQEFDRMFDYTDIYDKLNCLILTRHYIVDSIIAYWKNKGNFSVEDLTMDTDQLILIFSYVIIHSQVPNLFSELNFIDDFIDEFSLNAEPGFCITILQTALLYIHDTLQSNKETESLL